MFVKMRLPKEHECSQDWRALSIRAPHITKIIKKQKKIENRGRKLPECATFQYIALHQSKKSACGHVMSNNETLKKGKIIGICRMREVPKVVAKILDPAHFDGGNYSHFFEIADVFPLKNPIPARGWPSIFWKIKDNTSKKLLSNALFRHLGVDVSYSL